MYTLNIDFFFVSNRFLRIILFPLSLSLFCFPFSPFLPLRSLRRLFFVRFIGPFGIVGLLDGIDIAVETRASTLETLDGGPLLISTTVQSRSRRGKIYGNWILM